MTVNLSAFAGAGQQFFDDNGNPLAGGKIYSYQSGTTTPQATYTTSAGNIAHTNPIILDSVGRVPAGNEIWITTGQLYKFVLETSSATLIATLDNVCGIAANSDQLIYTPDSNSLLYPTPITIKAALDDITNNQTGSSVIGFLQSGTNAVNLTVENKLKQIVDVEDFGAVGNGTTDDTTAISNAAAAAIAAGVELVFDGTKTYAIDANQIEFAAGLRATTNGATLKLTLNTTSNTVGLIFNGPCTIDQINVSVPTGVRRDRCLRLQGDNVSVGAINLSSVDVQTTTEGLDFGVSVINGDNITINTISVLNYDRAVIIGDTNYSTIDSIYITSYLRGLYLYGNTSLSIGASTIRKRSPNASNSPGHNSVLMGNEGLATTAATGNGTTVTLTFDAQTVPPYFVGQRIYVQGISPSGYRGIYVVTACTTTTVSYAGTTTGVQTVAGTIYAIQTNVTLTDFVCEDAGEHSIRLGGGPQENISLIRPHIFNCQGDGIKLLGTDNTAPVVNESQKNILIDAPILEDTATSGSPTNSAILIQRSINVTIRNPLIIPRNQTYASSNGIRLYAATNVIIDSPYISDCSANGIDMGTAGGGADPADISRVMVLGGIIRLCGGDGINAVASTGQSIRQFVAKGTLLFVNGNAGATFDENGGTFPECILNVDLYDNAVDSIVCNSNGVYIDATGSDSFGTGSGSLATISAQNSSRWSNDTTLNIRKAGAWVAL